MLSRVLLRLLENFRYVEVYCVIGNHGRATPKHIGSHPRTNWDRVCYQNIKTMLLGTEANPRNELKSRLNIDVSDKFYSIVRVYDYGILLVHGDQIKGGFAGFPLYGTAKKVWGWIDAIPEKWDYLMFGHFHNATSGVLNLREFHCNGTTESSNVFAQEQLAAAGYPCQRLCFLNAEHGIISNSLIYLTEPGERLPALKRG